MKSMAFVPSQPCRGWLPYRGAVCAVVAIRDRVFRLELTFSQSNGARVAPCIIPTHATLDGVVAAS